jgi:hypothetical protein
MPGTCKNFAIPIQRGRNFKDSDRLIFARTDRQGIAMSGSGSFLRTDGQSFFFRVGDLSPRLHTTSALLRRDTVTCRDWVESVDVS